jgi:hypothetical protein
MSLNACLDEGAMSAGKARFIPDNAGSFDPNLLQVFFGQTV